MVRHSHTSSHSSSSSSSSHGSTTHHGGNSGGDGSSGSSGGSGGANPGGSGKGYGLHTDSLGTMEGNIGRTRDKVDGVGRTVGSANFGAQTMGVVGSGMTGTLNNALQGAQSQVAKATTAVENAGHQTKATRTAYETTEQSSANALKGFKSDGNGSTKPSGTGTSPSSAGGSGSGPGGSGSGGSGSGGSGDSGGSGSGGTPPSGGGGPNSPGHRGGQNTPGEHWQDTVRKNFSDKDYADFQRAMDKMSQDPKPGEVPGSGQLTQREKDLMARASGLAKIDDTTLMQKVIPPDTVKGYLGDLRSDGSFEGGNYKDIRGFVARNQDAGVFTRPDDIISSNRLDYANSPYHAGMSHAHTMEFPAGQSGNYQMPLGAPSVPNDLGGKNPMVQQHADDMVDAADNAGRDPQSYQRSVNHWPYSGTGITANQNGVPEFKMTQPMDIPAGATINEYDASGNKRTIAVFDTRRGWVQP